ncbi:uncharacterized protein LOC121600195 [Anopheles merus]|uniref:uncharacterized protein LOC121600195 n=1 Tax=Anopheles merus TaxID=30066 RepID=UPI001BE4C5A3|nr:uncharacterized protein LOC121600195 [Anopheles merus]XP_041784540.1 uncharacterized protein LOC121600195 [Anopheles merus]
MDTSKRLKKSGVASKRAKAIWERFEKEWEEENLPGTSSGVDQQASSYGNVQPDAVEVADMPMESEAADYVSDDDEDADCSVLEDDWSEGVLEDEVNEDEYFDADEAPEGNAYASRLRIWALTHKITHSALSDLLVLTRETTNISLPRCAKTLLKTPKQVERHFTAVGEGQLWYQGIQSTLQQYYRSVPPVIRLIEANIAVDGLPMHNSGPTQLWPILMHIVNLPALPIMVLGVFCGATKPSCLEGFLRPLVDDINRVLVQGIDVNGIIIDFRLKAIVADTPARAFIKGVTYPPGLEACIKCKIVGSHDGTKTIYEGTAEVRTDKEFRNGDYVKHQKYYTPLLDIDEVDIVTQTTIADDLHLFALGIEKKLLKGFTTGALHPFPKWSKQEQLEISNILVRIEYPSEIHRKPRALKYLGFWKGSELSAFLHHVSIPLLKNRISDEAYEHHKLFFIAVNLFSSRLFEQYWIFAGQLLEQFVLEYSTVYSRTHLTINVHNLLHVAADVENFGPLPFLSTYRIEDKLGFMKNLARTGHRTLNQIVCRLIELTQLEAADARKKDDRVYPSLKVKKDEVILLVKPKFMLRKGNRNGWFLTQEDQIVRYCTAEKSSDSYFIEGRLLKEKQPTFSQPCSSAIIYNFTARVEDLSQEIVRIELKEIKCKLVAVSLDQGNTFYFSPLLHTFES